MSVFDKTKGQGFYKLWTRGAADKTAKVDPHAQTLKVEVVGDSLTIGDTIIPKKSLREVRFNRKGSGNVEVVARVINEGTGVFRPSAGISNNVVGVVSTEGVQPLKLKLEANDVRMLDLSR